MVHLMALLLLLVACHLAGVFGVFLTSYECLRVAYSAASFAG